jgi:hypothetical protein
MFNMENVENKETIIEEVTEQKEESKGWEVNLNNTVKVALLGAVKPFAGGTVYAVGLGAGLLFGKKSGLKAMGTYAAVNAVYNVARFVTGEWDKED